MVEVATSATLQVLWKAETVFGTAPSSPTDVFGADCKVNYSVKRNHKTTKNFTDRLPSEIYPNTLEGSVDVDFVLTTNQEWLPHVFADGAGTGASPYAILGTSGKPASMTIFLNDLTTTKGKLQQLLGCVLSEFSLSASLNNPIKVKLSGPFRDIGAPTTQIAPTVDALGAIYNFTGGSLTVNAKTFDLLQKFDIRVSQKPERYPVFNSQLIGAIMLKEVGLVCSVSVKKSWDDTEPPAGAIQVAQTGLNGDIIATLECTADATHTFKITLSGTKYDEYSTSHEAGGADEEQNMVFIVNAITIQNQET